jgi:hypothetical protein
MKVAMALAIVAFVAYVVFLGGGFHRRFAHKLPAARAAAEVGSPIAVLDGRLKFDDVERQSREFIGYYHSIHLTPDQEETKAEALNGRPAACCRDSNARTCCCECNLSKTVWGLTNLAIARHHANADQVHEVVDAWLVFVNPGGYDGKTCYRGGCALPGDQKGCGGMSEDEIYL